MMNDVTYRCDGVSIESLSFSASQMCVAGHKGRQDLDLCWVGPSRCWLNQDVPSVLREGFPIPPRTSCSLLLPGNE